MLVIATIPFKIFFADLDSKCLVKEPTCFKNAENPSKIDLFITNSPLSFQNASVIDTGLSDFHRMIITVMKLLYQNHDHRKFSTETLTLLDSGYFHELYAQGGGQSDPLFFLRNC